MTAKIYIVEGEPARADLVRTLFEAEGFTVVIGEEEPEDRTPYAVVQSFTPKDPDLGWVHAVLVRAGLRGSETDVVLQHVADTIKSLRREHGYSLEALSRLCGLAITTISEMERNRIHPSLESLVKLSKAFQVPVREFFPET